MAIDDIDLYSVKRFRVDIVRYLSKVSRDRTLLVSHKSSALVTEFVVPDLVSFKGLNGSNKELKDSHKSLLIERATSRGFHLSAK